MDLMAVDTVRTMASVASSEVLQAAVGLIQALMLFIGVLVARRRS